MGKQLSHPLARQGPVEEKGD